MGESASMGIRCDFDRNLSEQMKKRELGDQNFAENFAENSLTEPRDADRAALRKLGNSINILINAAQGEKTATCRICISITHTYIYT